MFDIEPYEDPLGLPNDYIRIYGDPIGPIDFHIYGAYYGQGNPKQRLADGNFTGLKFENEMSILFKRLL